MAKERRFFEFLHQRIGLDVASVGAALIERAVRQRSEQVGAGHLDAYWALLQHSVQEQQALTEAVIVPETWFMRYPESFAAVARMARQLSQALAGTRALKLLSLPCSTGEEPYSLAMALLDAGLPPASFRIDGVDISPHSVAKAERGIYGRNSFRGSPLAFRERYFDQHSEGYRVHERVRQPVRLQAGNVLDPALLAGGGTYDFVFCRNLLIYFDPPTQRRVLETLKRFLHEEGVLFIGPAEGSLLASLGMRPMPIAQAFAFVRQAPQAASPVTAPVRPALALPQVLTPRPAMPPRPPLAVRPTVVADGANELLARIATFANEGNTAAALGACEQFLRDHPPRAQVFYWLGLLSDVSGKHVEAQGYYRKALYLEPQHAEALAHLAMLLAGQGDVAAARRLQERAARARGQAAERQRSEQR
ncbi:CheR family methyltransferase [Pseudomonas typographi]|uniref:Protein-glutamate O-methyltransferase CheR n=1 Tax=Pseudomonas typographi TaxID=2715964 RepID=A0ABR7Z7C9_9PSED|nr:protein-glutamate O-methyltransferase CheR [Pseudomonas typographi]MBD1553684.1 protein-glutamate O-methyltransferase CheR [Pseudomonas typographi]MBD1589044.1 protein-glutamate O-methyltransferase CheR [Pseudomonas typographi]MBD1601441.1 protein-glutamate O-methyltransferase CheR [Pseudomonas typographi]